MKTNALKFVAIAATVFYLCGCSNSSQGVNEAGSADSDSMMNVDTQYVDTSGAAGSGTTVNDGDTTSGTTGAGKVPVPTP